METKQSVGISSHLLPSSIARRRPLGSLDTVVIMIDLKSKCCVDDKTYEDRSVGKVLLWNSIVTRKVEVVCGITLRRHVCDTAKEVPRARGEPDELLFLDLATNRDQLYLGCWCSESDTLSRPFTLS